jgi:hypothetical protein
MGRPEKKKTKSQAPDAGWGTERVWEGEGEKEKTKARKTNPDLRVRPHTTRAEQRKAEEGEPQDDVANHTHSHVMWEGGGNGNLGCIQNASQIRG